jgi:hypothetical protein
MTESNGSRVFQCRSSVGWLSVVAGLLCVAFTAVAVCVQFDFFCGEASPVGGSLSPGYVSGSARSLIVGFFLVQGGLIPLILLALYGARGYLTRASWLLGVKIEVQAHGLTLLQRTSFTYVPWNEVAPIYLLGDIVGLRLFSTPMPALSLRHVVESDRFLQMVRPYLEQRPH